MITRFRWVFLAMLVGGAILWLVLAGGGQKRNGDEASFKDGTGQSKGAAARKGDPDGSGGRESSRHKTGEVEKNLATPLEKKVAEQEQLVNDKKKVLSALAKARNPIFLNPDGAPPADETPEEAAKKAQAEQDFNDARREYNTDRQLLLKLKTELAEEQAKGK